MPQKSSEAHSAARAREESPILGLFLGKTHGSHCGAGERNEESGGGPARGAEPEWGFELPGVHGAKGNALVGPLEINHLVKGQTAFPSSGTADHSLERMLGKRILQRTFWGLRAGGLGSLTSSDRLPPSSELPGEAQALPSLSQSPPPRPRRRSFQHCCPTQNPAPGSSGIPIQARVRSALDPTIQSLLPPGQSL